MDQIDIDMLHEYQNVSKQVFELDLLLRANLYKLQLEIPDTWLEYTRLKTIAADMPESDFINPICKSDVDKAKLKTKTSEIKKIYGKINRLTHPDKTDDVNLHYIFQLAKTYYDCNNIIELNILYDMVKLNTFADITNMLNKQRQKLFSQINSVEFQICTMYENPKTSNSAVQSFKQLILYEIANLNAKGIR